MSKIYKQNTLGIFQVLLFTADEAIKLASKKVANSKPILKTRQLCFVQASLNRDVPSCLLHFFLFKTSEKGKFSENGLFPNSKTQTEGRGYKGIKIVLSFSSREM